MTRFFGKSFACARREATAVDRESLGSVAQTTAQFAHTPSKTGSWYEGL